MTLAFVQLGQWLDASESRQAGSDCDALLLRIWFRLSLLGSLAGKAGPEAFQHTSLLCG